MLRKIGAEVNYFGYDHGEDALIEKEELEQAKAERAAKWKRRKAWFCWIRRAWFLLNGLYLFDGHLYGAPGATHAKKNSVGACLTCGQD